MQLADFFEQNIQVSNHTVIVCKGEDDYPLLFFSYFLKYFRSTSKVTVESLDLQDLPMNEIQVKLETCFLGMQTIFWLRSYDFLDEKNKKIWTSYLNVYQGPHTILFFTTDAKQFQRRECLEIPRSINKQQYLLFMRWFSLKPSAVGTHMITQLFKRYDTIALDAACMIMHYTSLASIGSQSQLDGMVDDLISPEQSLFALSSAFFSRQTAQFFSLWSTIHEHYNTMFWLSYWSEQLWRAVQFIHYMNERNNVEARKIGYRLPFSFMQKDWKRWDVQELVDAHQFLYEIDFAVKNGNQAPLLDLFYLKYVRDNKR